MLQGDARYQPALDGVRAVAVTCVLAFHGGVGWMPGGYLGVSVFFTLSGFLITRLLLAEHQRTGRIALGQFATRRARRLLPASTICLVGVVVAARLGAFPGATDLRREVLGAVFQVANWVALAGGGSYADLLDESAGVASPLEHYWSLAIEEQFYWIWPVAFVGVSALAASGPARRTAVLAVTAIAAVCAPLVALVWGADAAYWATPARIAEILVGAALAVVLDERDRCGRELASRTGVLAPVALAVVLACCVWFPSAAGPAYSGALPVFALASGALLLGLQCPGRTQRVLSSAPFVGLGRISYGVYLYHWPLFVALDQQRTGLDGIALLALRVSCTLAVAVVSYVVVERPIRTASRLTPRPTLAGAAALTATVVVVTVAMLPSDTTDYWRLDARALEAAAPAAAPADLVPLRATDAEPEAGRRDGTSVDEVLGRGTTGPPPADAQPTALSDGGPAPADGGASRAAAPAGSPEPQVSTIAETTATAPHLDAGIDLARPVRVVVVGDSIAESLGAGLVRVASARPDLVTVSIVTAPGCGFVRSGEYKVGDTWTTRPPSCDRLLGQRVPEAVSVIRPDVVVVTATSWDLNERRWDVEVLLPTDAAYRRRITEDYLELTRTILDRSDAVVAWVRHPLPNPFWLGQGTIQERRSNHEVLWSAMALAEHLHPGRVRVLDFEGWAAHTGIDAETAARPDGIHWTVEASERVAGEYLVPWTVRLALGDGPA